MGRITFGANNLQRCLFALAMFALVARISVPAGYMIAPTDGTGGFPQLVICTGHGPLQLTAAGGHAPAPVKRDLAHACTFAGAGAPLTAPAGAHDSITPMMVAGPTLIAAVAHARPGLGLAAPPPPSHAPPTVLI